MIDRLKNEVQNPTHIIPEDSMESWVRLRFTIAPNCKVKEYMKRLSQN